MWPRAIRCFKAPAAGHSFEHTQLVLGPGDMAVFRGDLVHAGAAFAEFSIRLHTYLDVEDQANKTCFVAPHYDLLVKTTPT